MHDTDAWRNGRRALAAIAIAFVLFVAIALWRTATRSPDQHDSAVDLTIALAPFIAVALAIERFWEALFSVYENFALATARLIGVGGKFTDWARVEADNAASAVKSAAAALGNSVPEPARWATFQEAEKRFLDAQARIGESLKSPEYVSIKRAVTLLGSLCIGVVLGISMELQLFERAGFDLPDGVDALLTGLLIGAGPGPLHSLMGVLQELRNSVAGFADLTRGNGLKKAAESVRQAAAAAAHTTDDTGGGLPSATAAVLRHSRDATRLLRPPA